MVAERLPVTTRIRVTTSLLADDTMSEPSRRLCTIDGTDGRAGVVLTPEELLADREYERRFLVADTSVLESADFDWIDQAFLWSKGGYTVRIRLINDDPFDAARASGVPGVLALKGPRKGASRYEAEVPIDRDVARSLIQAAAYRLTKRRYAVITNGDTWVIDVFTGPNEGLVIAEFEGSPMAVAALRVPTWCGREVTDEREYDNENLARRGSLTPFDERR